MLVRNFLDIQCTEIVVRFFHVSQEFLRYSYGPQKESVRIFHARQEFLRHTVHRERLTGFFIFVLNF